VTALATGDAGEVAIKNGHILASGPDIDQVPYSGGDVTAVGAGDSFAVALHGGVVTVWSSAHYNHGVLNVPPAAQQPGAIAAISVGYAHILALTTDGHVLAWGDNGYGESTPTIGVYAPFNDRATAIAAGDSVSFAVDAVDGSVVGWGDQSAAAVPPGARSQVVSVAASFVGSVAAALRDDGSVVSWNYQTGSVISVPAAAASGIVAIAAGSAYSVAALRLDGTVIQWNEAGTVVPNPLATPSGKWVVALAASSGDGFGVIQSATPAGSGPITASIGGVRECVTTWAVGRPVTMLPCITDSTNPDWASQRFFPRYNPSSNTDFRIYNSLYNSCLTPTGLTNGAILTLAACTGAANQSWFNNRLANGTMVVTNRAAGLSIDSSYGSTLAGTQLVIGHSTGTPTQTWAVYPNYVGI
jgi:hypothetical protein